jgi:arsenate reductase
MAEGFLKSFDPTLEVVSAGTEPGDRVNPRAVTVMKEIGIDISNGYPSNVTEFVNQPFDYVITVCDGAKEKCPAFTGEVKHRLHIGFDDPAEATGSDEYIISEFRRIRDEIKRDFSKFFNKKLKNKY